MGLRAEGRFPEGLLARRWGSLPLNPSWLLVWPIAMIPACSFMLVGLSLSELTVDFGSEKTHLEQSHEISLTSLTGQDGPLIPTGLSAGRHLQAGGPPPEPQPERPAGCCRGPA